MKLHQKGFSLLEVLLLLLVIGLICLVGFLVYVGNSSNEPANALNTIEERVDENEDNSMLSMTHMNIPTYDIPSDWEIVTEDVYRLTFGFPKVSNCFYNKTEHGMDYTVFSLTCPLGKGAAAQPLNINATKTGSEYDNPEFVTSIDAGSIGWKYLGETKITKGNGVGTRRIFEDADDHTCKVIYYYLRFGDYSFMITIDCEGSSSDINVTELGENIFETLYFTP